MEVTIRKENRTDYDKVYDLVKEAFRTAEHADGTEQDLVNRLRKSQNFIPNLSLVAEVNKEIVGHLLMTKIMIEGHNEKHEALALAPLAVLPSYQKQGIGSYLVKEGLKAAQELWYKGVIVLGSERYYPKFGFEEAKKYQIQAPFEVPSQNFMVIELWEGGLKGISGTVCYAKEFFEA